jgi:hypothetical protein
MSYASRLRPITSRHGPPGRLRGIFSYSQSHMDDRDFSPQKFALASKFHGCTQSIPTIPTAPDEQDHHTMNSGYNESWVNFVHWNDFRSACGERFSQVGLLYSEPSTQDCRRLITAPVEFRRFKQLEKHPTHGDSATNLPVLLVIEKARLFQEAAR